MTLLIALFFFGAFLFLLGLIGKVKAFEVEVGTDSKTIRGISLLLGTILMLQSFNDQHQYETPIIQQELPQIQKEPEVSKTNDMPYKKKVIGQATLTYWNNFIKIFNDVPKSLNNLEDTTIAHLKRINKTFINHYIKIRNLQIKDVDDELTKLSTDLQIELNKSINIMDDMIPRFVRSSLKIKEYEQGLITNQIFQDSRDNFKYEMEKSILKWSNSIEKIRQYKNKLNHLRITLTNRYNIEFSPL